MGLKWWSAVTSIVEVMLVLWRLPHGSVRTVAKPNGAKWLRNQNFYEFPNEDQVVNIQMFFCRSFVNPESPLSKIEGQGDAAELVDTTHTYASLAAEGWNLAHAIKTSGSAQLNAFNFLLIFQK